MSACSRWRARLKSPGEHVVDAEPALHLVGAGLGDRDLLELLVDDVVLLGREPRDQPRELDVLVGRLLGVAADDQRRAGLVDEDVVDLVDDRVEVAALDAVGEVDDEVVAQEVEAELVVRAVGDVRGVRLAPRHRAQVAQPLVGGGEVRVEDEVRPRAGSSRRSSRADGRPRRSTARRAWRGSR